LLASWWWRRFTEVCDDEDADDGLSIDDISSSRVVPFVENAGGDLVDGTRHSFVMEFALAPCLFGYSIQHLFIGIVSFDSIDIHLYNKSLDSIILS